ncbi:MAG: hypothetical protein WC495_05390 [Patescibacteria group bacterium]|jgi:hypothetical protein
MSDKPKMTAWSVLEPYLTGESPSYLESIARDATTFAKFHIAPANIRHILTGEIPPEYNEAAIILDWINDRLFPRLGIRQRFTLPELFPAQFKKPMLRDEVRLIIGRDALAGKTVSEEDVVHLFGQTGLKEFKAKGYKPGNDGRYPTEDLFYLLLSNPSLELAIQPGDSVYFVPEPALPQAEVEVKRSPGRPKKETE